MNFQREEADTIAITGMGSFSVHPKSASGSGSFTHTFASGGSASFCEVVTGEDVYIKEWRNRGTPGEEVSARAVIPSNPFKEGRDEEKGQP